MPAKAGIQRYLLFSDLDSSLRWNDESE